MKKLSKTLLAIAAVSAASMAMTASAMAMDASYADGVVNVDNISEKGASQTLLVVPKGTETVTEEDIYQIDQKDGTVEVPATFVGENIMLDVSKLTPGATYEVRIGGTNGTIDVAEFTVPGGDPGDQTITIMIGDVDESNAINSLDVAFVARYAGDATENIGNVGQTMAVSGEDRTITIGDVDDSSAINSLDVTFIARFAGDATENIGQVGQTVTVVSE